jgi:hypothetical protein
VLVKESEENREETVGWSHFGRVGDERGMVLQLCAEGGSPRVRRGGARSTAVAMSWWRLHHFRLRKEESEVGKAGLSGLSGRRPGGLGNSYGASFRPKSAGPECWVGPDVAGEKQADELRE